jgi:succinate dehydrogenase / fumarate reductase, cytochrome b subunit
VREPDIDETEPIRTARETAGPVLRKGGPGGVSWFDVRHVRTGHWAFSVNRLVALGLVFYLYLHLAVLSQLLRGPSAWHGFLKLATAPAFLGLDIILIVGLLFHGLNGLRLALVGTGIAPNAHKALFWSFMVFGAILLLGATLHILGSG